jgi:hypothetical protein
MANIECHISLLESICISSKHKQDALLESISSATKHHQML